MSLYYAHMQLRFCRNVKLPTRRLLSLEVPSAIQSRIGHEIHNRIVEESQIPAVMSVCHYDASLFSSRRRNHMLSSHRKDGLIEWLKELLRHSFVLDAAGTYADTFSHFEDLVEEHKRDPLRSQLKQYVPSIGVFHTSLPMRQAFKVYDDKYAISLRRHLPPTFNEIRHILNLAQVMALAKTLSLISFDGDQTLYSDGGNFDENEELAMGIIYLMKSGVKVALITAAGYGLDNTKYEIRLGGLLDKFITSNLTEEEVGRFYVFGGECNYLFQCSRSDGPKCFLRPILPEVWQDDKFAGPKPMHWPAEEVTRILDIAERSMTETISQLRLRAKILRKDRAIGVFPGGDSMVEVHPKGHGSKKLKREALDELVLRVMESIRTVEPPLTLPFCVFNGGRDAWLDVGNKKVGVEALQAFFGLDNHNCLHVGDQFLNTGNDLAARETCPCIWITSPRETQKILEHVLKFMGITTASIAKFSESDDSSGKKRVFNVYTGEKS